MKKQPLSIILRTVLSCILVMTLVGSAAAEITFGVLPRLSAMELYTMFNPLTEYLSKEVGEKVSLVIPKDFDAFKAAVSSGHLDMGFSNSLVYVQLRKNMALVPLALAVEPKAGSKFRGIIVARKDSGIEKPQDLKGKRLVFVEKDSAAGYIFQMLFLKKSGLDLHKDFITLPFAKKHDNVIMAVFNKAADAGGIREDDLEKMKDKVDLTQLKIVAYTDYFPNWPVFAMPSMKKEVAAKITAALLKLSKDPAAAARVLGPAKLSGFAPAADKDYDQLRHAAKLVGAL